MQASYREGHTRPNFMCSVLFSFTPCVCKRIIRCDVSSLKMFLQPFLGLDEKIVFKNKYILIPHDVHPTVFNWGPVTGHISFRVTVKYTCHHSEAVTSSVPWLLQ